MLRQPKYQSILVLVLCLLGVVLAFMLLPPSDLLQWHISVIDYSPIDYRIEVTSQTLAVSGCLTDDAPPYADFSVHSPKGICLGESEFEWEISANERLREEKVLQLFWWAFPLILLSLLMLVFAFVNVLWRWWERRYFILLIPFGLCLIWIFVARLLGPRMSIEPDWSLYDFDCAYSLVMKAELISVNQTAITSFIILSLLFVSVESIVAVILIRSLFNKVSKESHGNDIINV